MNAPRCPICRRGVLLEWLAGMYCSRRYAKRGKTCDFEIGICNNRAQYRRQVAAWRAAKRSAG